MLSPLLLQTSEFTQYITGALSTNVNLETLFGASAYASGINKRVIVDSGTAVGSVGSSSYALEIPAGFGGRIYLINKGYIIGRGGSGGNAINGNGSDGDDAIFAGAPNIFIDNRGLIAGGGGGGGRGGTGGNGTYDSTYAASICTCPVCCGYSCTDTAPCTGGYTNEPNNGCAEGGWRWFCPQTSNSSGTIGGNGGSGAGYPYGATTGDSASNATNNAGTGGDGGDGGGWGLDGDDGDPGANGNDTNGLSGFSGGSAGRYIVNNSNVTWITTGNVSGGVG